MVFTLLINGYDFSDCIQQETDIKESMRRITGPAQGPAVDGTMIPDLIARKWDPSFLLAPLQQSRMATLLALMEQETVTLQYTSVKLNGSLRQIEAMPVSMTVQYATQDWNDERVYAPTPISFEEV